MWRTGVVPNMNRVSQRQPSSKTMEPVLSSLLLSTVLSCSAIRQRSSLLDSWRHTTPAKRFSLMLGQQLQGSNCRAVAAQRAYEQLKPASSKGCVQDDRGRGQLNAPNRSKFC